jgi:hypothetical protein
VYKRQEVEYRKAIEDYTNIYTQANGTLDFGNVKTYAVYRVSGDDKTDPLTFTLSPVEIESLTLAGDSARVLHTYADTSAEGSYIIQDNHFVFVGQGNGDYEVTFFYVGEGNGDYIYDPVLSAFAYQGPQLGNYSPTKALPLPRREEFIGLGAEFFESLTIGLFGSRRDQNTFSPLDDEDNTGYGYQAQLDKTIGILALRGNYLRYNDDFFSPTSREAVDYRYVWNTSDTLKEVAELSVALTPANYINLEAGYGALNREYQRKHITLRPLFFFFGYEGIDTLNRFFAGFTKKYRAFDANGRYEMYGPTRILNYGIQYAVSKNIGLGLVGAYDRDTLTAGVSNTVNLTTPILALSAGHRSISDTTFLFGNATVNYTHKGFSLNGDLQQSQRYSQKRDEAFLKVEDGTGDYVYDPITNSYVKKEGGDYLRKTYLLPDFTRVITRNFGVDIGYTRSVSYTHLTLPTTPYV